MLIVFAPIFGSLFIRDMDFEGPLNFTRQRAPLFNGDSGSFQYTVSRFGFPNVTLPVWVIKDGRVVLGNTATAAEVK